MNQVNINIINGINEIILNNNFEPSTKLYDELAILITKDTEVIFYLNPNIFTLIILNASNKDVVTQLIDTLFEVNIKGYKENKSFKKESVIKFLENLLVSKLFYDEYQEKFVDLYSSSIEFRQDKDFKSVLFNTQASDLIDKKILQLLIEDIDNTKISTDMEYIARQVLPILNCCWSIFGQLEPTVRNSFYEVVFLSLQKYAQHSPEAGSELVTYLSSFYTFLNRQKLPKESIIPNNIYQILNDLYTTYNSDNKVKAELVKIFYILNYIGKEPTLVAPIVNKIDAYIEALNTEVELLELYKHIERDNSNALGAYLEHSEGVISGKALLFPKFFEYLANNDKYSYKESLIKVVSAQSIAHFDLIDLKKQDDSTRQLVLLRTLNIANSNMTVDVLPIAHQILSGHEKFFSETVIKELKALVQKGATLSNTVLLEEMYKFAILTYEFLDDSNKRELTLEYIKALETATPESFSMLLKVVLLCWNILPLVSRDSILKIIVEDIKAVDDLIQLEQVTTTLSSSVKKIDKSHKQHIEDLNKYLGELENEEKASLVKEKLGPLLQI